MKLCHSSCHNHDKNVHLLSELANNISWSTSFKKKKRSSVTGSQTGNEIIQKGQT